MASLKQTMEHSLLKVAQTVEHQLDAELERLENLNSDDMEKLREQRLKEMKKQALQQQEWRILVRHSYQHYAASCCKYLVSVNRSKGSKHTLFHSFIPFSLISMHFSLISSSLIIMN